MHTLVTRAQRMHRSIEKTYGRQGQPVVQMNLAAVDGALERMHHVTVPDRVTTRRDRIPLVPVDAPAFIHEVTAMMFAGRGDDIPVSRMPADGTFPSGTSAYEKRSVSDTVAEWRPELCIQCGQCSFVCPHGVIRSRYYSEEALAGAPQEFPTAAINARLPRHAVHPSGLSRGLHRLRVVR